MLAFAVLLLTFLPFVPLCYIWSSINKHLLPHLDFGFCKTWKFEMSLIVDRCSLIEVNTIHGKSHHQLLTIPKTLSYILHMPVSSSNELYNCFGDFNKVHIIQGDHVVKAMIVSWVTVDEPGSNTVVYWAQKSKRESRQPRAFLLNTHTSIILLASFTIAILLIWR